MGTVAESVGQALAEAGVRHVFGVVGNGNIRLTAELVAAGVRYVPARNEAGTTAMADAYHRVSGAVGVCTVTYGPGLTNAATGLADAVKQRSAVLVLCGDAPTDRTRAIDIDQAAFVAALGAISVRITDPGQAATAVHSGLRRARIERCPVVLFVPANLQNASVDQARAATPQTTVYPPSTPVAPTLSGREPALGMRPGGHRQSIVPSQVSPAARIAHRSDPAVSAALAALAGAERPLLLAGLGAWQARAQKPIAELADRCGALLATTLLAKGLFDGHPWSLGVCGGLASPRAAELIGQADVMVAFGAGLNEWTLHGGRAVRPEATVVQVDVRPAPTSPRVDIGVVGDAHDVAVALLDGVPSLRPFHTSWRSRLVDGSPRVGGQQRVGGLWRMGWRWENYVDRGTLDRLDPRTLSRALADLLPRDYTLVTDGGHFIGWPAMYWPVPDPASFVFTGAAFQSIGLGFAGAVGAAHGRPERTTVLAAGDGGALMGLAELETLVRTARSALVVIYDDAAYGAEVHLAQDVDPALSTFTDTDFAGIARSLGAGATVVRTLDDLAGVRDWLAAGARGVYLLDCKVVPQVVGQFLVEMSAVVRGEAPTVPHR